MRGRARRRRAAGRRRTETDRRLHPAKVSCAGVELGGDLRTRAHSPSHNAHHTQSRCSIPANGRARWPLYAWEGEGDWRLLQEGMQRPALRQLNNREAIVGPKLGGRASAALPIIMAKLGGTLGGRRRWLGLGLVVGTRGERRVLDWITPGRLRVPPPPSLPLLTLTRRHPLPTPRSRSPP